MLLDINKEGGNAFVSVFDQLTTPVLGSPFVAASLACIDNACVAHYHHNHLTTTTTANN